MPKLAHRALSQELIGACVTHHHEQEEVSDLLFRVPDAVFQDSDHQYIWNTMREMSVEGIPTTLQLVSHRLDTHEAITELDMCWVNAGYTHYAHHFADELIRTFAPQSSPYSIPELPADDS